MFFWFQLIKLKISMNNGFLVSIKDSKVSSCYRGGSRGGGGTGTDLLRLTQSVGIVILRQDQVILVDYRAALAGWYHLHHFRNPLRPLPIFLT